MTGLTSAGPRTSASCQRSSGTRRELPVADPTRAPAPALPLDDATDVHQVIASVDQVAADAYGCTLIGQKPENIEYLKLGHERGIGVMHWETLPYVVV